MLMELLITGKHKRKKEDKDTKRKIIEKGDQLTLEKEDNHTDLKYQGLHSMENYLNTKDFTA